MGNRLNKTLGYLMIEDKVSTFLKSDHQEILQKLYSLKSDVFCQKFEESYNQHITNKSKEPLMLSMTLREIKSCVDNNRIRLADLIKMPMQENEHVLFRTVSHAADARYGDLIDAYENTYKEDNIHFLQQPIYPDYGYIYTGGLDHLIDDINERKIHGEYMSEYASIINEHFFENALNVYGDSGDYKRAISTYFHPNVSTFAYLAAQAVGIMKDDVDIKDFKLALDPVILSYWS